MWRISGFWLVLVWPDKDNAIFAKEDESMKYSELAEKLGKLGMRHVAQNESLHKWFDPTSGSSVVIADEGANELGPVALAHVEEALNVTVKELEGV